MPYPGIPDSKIPMMDKCVIDVMSKNKDMSKSSAIAVCHKQVMGSDATDGAIKALTAAVWDTAYINDLPDSSFAVIEPGGKKDSDGKTTPRSLRHLPFKDKDGKIDLPHLRNALARLDQTSLSPELKSKAKVVLEKAAKSKEIGDRKKANDMIGTFKSIINLDFIAAENGGKLPSEIEVLPCGEWMTAPYGPINIDPSVFDQMVGNFERDVRKAVPVDVDHDGGKAAGWIQKLINKGNNGLWAAVEWTEYGMDLLNKKLYKFFSPEWSFDYVDPQYSTHHGAVLVAGSLTNRPLFKELPFLVANEDGTFYNEKDLTKAKTIVLLFNKANETTMKPEEILAKKPVDRSDEEKKFLETAELTNEQKSQVETETKEAEDAAKAEAEKAEGKQEAESAAKEENVEACEKGLVKSGMSKEEAHTAAEKMVADIKAGKENVTIKASELEGLKKDSEELKKAKEQLRRTATEKEVAVLVASEKGGKILPKQKDAVIDFIMTCSEDQKAKFMEIVNALPEIKIAGEAGDGTIGALTAKEKISKLVEEKIEKAKTANEKLTKSEAVRQVLRENTELAKQYDEELKSK